MHLSLYHGFRMALNLLKLCLHLQHSFIELSCLTEELEPPLNSTVVKKEVDSSCHFLQAVVLSEDLTVKPSRYSYYITALDWPTLKHMLKNS